MAAYYNEFDPFAAEWLRELIKDGLIADGEVDNRDMREVDANDIRGFTQHHFFAGIGGWSYALRLAGWGDNRPVITGSPPCQPFSHAGKRKGQSDERHLWPAFFNLIRELRPATVFGEQVASAIRDEWFDALQADMEGEGYATGLVVLPACSVNAPHKRDRLYYFTKQIWERVMYTADCDPDGDGWCAMRDTDPAVCDCIGPTQDGVEYTTINGDLFGRHKRLDDSQCEGLEGYSRSNHQAGKQPYSHRSGAEGSVSVDWGNSRYTRFRDGKCRQIPVEPSLFPLAYGLPNRVGILRGAGNAIVPQVAAEVIKAFMEYLK